MKLELITTGELTKDNYFDVGNDRKIVISNSGMTEINVNQGGSFKRFKAYIQGQGEKKESISLDRGKLLHKFKESPDTFIVEPEEGPTPLVKPIVDSVFEEIRRRGLTPGEIYNHGDMVLEFANTANFGGGRLGTQALLKKIVVDGRGAAYFDFLVKAAGSHMVSAATKVILDNVISSMQASKEADRIFREKTTPIKKYEDILSLENGIFIAKELPLLIKIDGILCKCLLDYVRIDLIRGEVMIRDLKTTSKPINLFMGHYEYQYKEVTMHQESKIVGGESKTERIEIPALVHRTGQFHTYHIYRQLALYRLAIATLLSYLKVDATNFKCDAFVDVAETIFPYEFGPVYVQPDWMSAGDAEVIGCIEQVKDYMKEENIEPQW